ncbi:MAG: hypothetical protein GF388_10660 [Candidatus Aegiribacteria sp.]|nr:hypothetical protein [Candidatus Aegiribacteria sp.]MBD3295477.1 hypothetical protein [Candidatus Fermentibacteria bacterium]
MKHFFMLLLVVTAAVTAEPFVRFGPAVRLIFPSIDLPEAVSSASELDGIFFPGDPELLIGAQFELDLLPGYPVEVSGSYTSYDPVLELTQSFPDSFTVVNRDGHLAVVTAGVSKRIAGIRLLAGADIFFYREKWFEEDDSGQSGFHREYSETVAGPYIGVAKDFPLSMTQVEMDIRLHLPDFSERWVSAGVSVLFD